MWETWGKASLVARTSAYNHTFTRKPGWAKGIIVAVHLTAIANTPGITPSIRWRIGSTDNYETIITGGKLTTADTHAFLAVYPGTMSASGLSNITVAQLPLPPTLDIAIAVDDTDAATYDIYYHWLA